MTTYNKLPYSNQFERGHSFNWAGQWKPGRYYYNNSYVTDFVIYNHAVLVCRKDHLASAELEPELIVSGGETVDVNSSYWEFIVAVSGDSSYLIQNMVYDDRTKSITIFYGGNRSETFPLNIIDTSIHIGSSPPEDLHKLWLDTSNSGNIVLKQYINDNWKIISSSAVCDNYVSQSDLSNRFITLTESDYEQLEHPNVNTYYFTYEDE